MPIKPESVLNEFPYPIASVYADLNDPAASLQLKQEALYFTVYQLMRSAALPLVGEYLGKETLPEGTERAQRKLNGAIVRMSYLKALWIREDLVKRNPGSADYAWDAFVSHYELAQHEHAIEGNQEEAAVEHLRAAHEIVETLDAEDRLPHQDARRKLEQLRGMQE